MEETPSSSNYQEGHAVADANEFHHASRFQPSPSFIGSGARRKTYPRHQQAGNHQEQNKHRHTMNNRHDPSQGIRGIARGGTKAYGWRGGLYRETVDGQTKYSGEYRTKRSRTKEEGLKDIDEQGVHWTRNQPDIRGTQRYKRHQARRLEDLQERRCLPETQCSFRQQDKSAMTTRGHGCGSEKTHACESTCATLALSKSHTAKSSDDSAYRNPRLVKPATKTPPFTEQQLQSFLEQTPFDVLYELVRKKAECLALLNQDKVGDKILELTVQVLSALCDLDPVSDAAYNKELSIVLGMVESSLFLSKHLTRYLVSLPIKQPDECDGDDGNVPQCLGMILGLLRMFLQYKPSAYSEICGALILLERLMTPGDIMEELKQLKIGYNSVEQDQKAAKQRAMDKKPPNNFRDIPIFPESTEIRQVTKPFIRKNIIKGRYENVEHYLDVQFRLLREDFVAPLREGVTEFLSDTTGRPQDIRIYNDVVIQHRTMGENGFVYTIEFDIRPLKRVRWETNKRLLYGSFVCLTRDQFRHIVCATVENRKPQDLEKGLVGVRFLGDVPLAKGPFTMAESAAYFEAYRHVLQGLQQMNDYRFPFKKHIVDVASIVKPPVYFEDNHDIMYDLRSVAGIEEYDWKVSDVPILHQESWPSAEDLHLDQSQKAALHAALTREFAIIQGPPGTGKTYIGLKIIQLLLKNDQWKHDDVKSPILVVCYTNHALDQFLEGIITLGENNVVRVGSRSSSEVLESKNLSRLRRERPRQGLRHEDRKALRVKEEAIQSCLYTLDLPTKVLLNVEALQDYMTRGEYFALSLRRQKDEPPAEQADKLLHWLNVVDWKDESDSYQAPQYYQSKQLDGNERIHVEDEGYRIQQERQIGDSHWRQVREERKQNLKDEIFCNYAAYPQSTNKRCGKNHNVLPVVELQKPDMMTEEEADSVERVWHLMIWDRWRLYRLWVKKYLEFHGAILNTDQQRYEELSRVVQDTNVVEDLRILEEANVIGMTTTGAAKHREVLQRLGPRIVVVEEAAEVLEAHIITTLTANCQHLILIGDHQQLKPNPTVYRLAKLFNLDTSLFERMINNGMPCQSLTHQHRMRPEISTVMKKHFYKNLHDDESVLNMDDVRGVAHNMFFIDHQHLEDEDDDDRTKSNKYEAEVLVELCKYLLRQGYKPSQITILTTYTGQLFCFRRIMDKETFQGVRVCVVDNFQGEENDIILLSLVRSNEGGSIGFLKTSNRVCVALSRARMGFYCIGNASILKKVQIWQDILATLEAENQIGSSLQLVCQNHPKKTTQVTNVQDFEKMVPCGGCDVHCEYRLPCGHACTLWCHPDDPNHEEYECEKPCLVSCDRQHLCPLQCYEECKCMVKLTKTMPDCGHVIQVFCHEFDDITCTEPCPRSCDACQHRCQKKCGQSCLKSCPEKCERGLSCGHTCMVPCGKPCTPYCKVRVERTVPKCGHDVVMDCGENPDEYKCNISVNRVLPICGHPAKMRCHADLDNVECTERCEKLLLCGHQCPNVCGQPCQLSEFVLELKKRTIFLRDRPMLCAEPMEQIYPSCGHSVTLLCHQSLRSVPCSSRCEQVLACGHQCPRKCSQRCPEEEGRGLFHWYRCQESCERELPCEHKCPNKCGEPCPQARPDSRRRYGSTIIITECQVEVEKKLPYCNHTVCVPCFKDASYIVCKEKCGKVLPCTHRCPGKCGEPCPPATPHPRSKNMLKCKEIVKKTLPKCSHTVRVRCFVDVSSFVCEENCQKVLPCSHQCPNKCSEPCPGDVALKTNKSRITTKGRRRAFPRERCDVVVQKDLPCGHGSKIMPCWKAESAANIPCREPCRDILACGHKCNGDCDSCKQGSQHKPCTKHCNRQLVCGHYCNDTCSRVCSPDCRRCRDTTRPGTGHELTNRVPCKHNIRQNYLNACIRPCNQKLQCKHPCIGVCGEPCPPFCNICDGGKVRSKLPKGRVALRDTFIYIPDCKHLCETRYLDRMVVTAKNSLERSYSQIRSLLCPKCKEPIRHCHRYDSILLTINESVGAVKQLCNQTKMKTGDGGATAIPSFAVGKWMRCRHGHVFYQEERGKLTGRRQELRCPKCSK